MKNRLVVVIPVFRQTLEWYEIISIRRSIEVLNTYRHVLILPDTLDAEHVLSIYKAFGKDVFIKRFSSSYFENPTTYNRLMLLSAFYKEFENFDYLLVCQTDVFVFKDNIETWMKYRFDYVGAPWIDWAPSSFRAKEVSVTKRILWKMGLRRFDSVGNGGFSLRYVPKMIEITNRFHYEASIYPHNEDYFFAFEAKKLKCNINIPSVRLALRFCIDENPEVAFSMGGNILPMACHAFHRNFSFWRSFINKK